MTSTILYHFESNRSQASKDDQATWFFWQKASPYSIQGKLKKCDITENLPCEIYTIGGTDRVWIGLIFDVPNRYKNYLHEVRLFFPTPNANDNPIQTMP